MTTKKKIIFSLIPTILVLTLLGIGCYAGYFLAKREYRNQIILHSSSETLGKILEDEEKVQFAKAYIDGEDIIEDMDKFSWAIPNVMTPFVGNGPKPGNHYNAYINSFQFRANKEIKIPKPYNIYRIFITGGSTAYGSGAPSNDRTIGGYLNKMLNDELSPITKYQYDVFTMANPGWTSTHERIMIENRLSDLEPDLILSISGNNDVHWSREGRNVLWFKSYEDNFYWEIINTIYDLFELGQMQDVTKIESIPISPSMVADRLIKNITLSSFALSLKNIDYIFFLQPTLSVTKKALTDYEREKSGVKNQQKKSYFIRSYNEIDSRLKMLSITNFHYFNLADVFDNMGQEDHVFLDSYHFGDRGNKIIASQVFEHLKDVIVFHSLAEEDRNIDTKNR